MCCGRILASALSRSAVDFAALTSMRIWRSSSLTASGASEVVSTPPAMPAVDLAERDLVGDEDRGLEAGAAGLLDVVGRRLGRQLAAQHDFTGQVEVAAVLEHGAGDRLAEALVLEREAGHEAVERGLEHVLVGGLGVGPVRAGEGDPVAADHGGLADCGVDVRSVDGLSGPYVKSYAPVAFVGPTLSSVIRLVLSVTAVGLLMVCPQASAASGQWPCERQVGARPSRRADHRRAARGVPRRGRRGAQHAGEGRAGRGAARWRRR